jgi:hypothetical protein
MQWYSASYCSIQQSQQKKENLQKIPQIVFE